MSAERPLPRQPRLPLRTLERWMQSVIVHPGQTERAISDSCAEQGVSRAVADRVFLPSRTLSPTERIGIYQGMYPLRMQEALSSDYPYVKAWVGDHVFEHLVEDYVQEYPSRSYTLNRLGDSFPDFLASSPRARRAAVLSDLARLELAFTNAFDAEETPVLSAADLAKVPPASWGSARFEMVPSFRLLHLSHPVGLFVDAVREKRPAPSIRRAAAHYAVYRRDFAVYRLDLTPAQRQLLRSLVDGETLSAAVRATISGLSRRRTVRPEEVFESFRDFASQGLFAKVQAR